MNQETNNNLENTQTIPENTQQINLQQTQEIAVQTSTTNESVETVQPALTPTVDTTAPVDNKIEVDTKPHDIPIPDESDKKDFVIKSKKETVAEELKQREARIEEHVRQANANYKPNSKLKNALLIFFLIFIICFTIFLPDIHAFITKLKSGELKPKEEVKITDGTLYCTYKKSSEDLDYNYDYEFKFTNNRVQSYVRIVTTKGDTTVDKDTLDKLKADCNIMKNESDNINGITTSCKSESNSITVTEKIELDSYEYGSITSVYSEAGGNNPEFTYEQDMDDIEKNMKATGFTCERK